MKNKSRVLVLCVLFLLSGCVVEEKVEVRNDYEGTISMESENGTHKVKTTIEYVGKKGLVKISHGDKIFNRIIVRNDLGEMVGNINGRTPMFHSTIHKEEIVVQEDIIPLYLLNEMKKGEKYEIEATAVFSENIEEKDKVDHNITLKTIFEYK